MKTIVKKSIFPGVIKTLTHFGTRQGLALQKTCTYIYVLLEEHGIPFQTETYKVILPAWKKWSLKADGKSIACLPTGMSSGNVTDVHAITSSLISSRYFLDVPHINFNPKSAAISRANFSFAPSLAVSRESISGVCKAKNIRGHITVEKKKGSALQILVGNTKNPKRILFSHFDSIGPGAVDNASGTALMLQLIIDNPQFLNENLFVLDGNEELSYDYPVYWGKGYRNFEKKYALQMSMAKKLIVVDCVGYAPTEIVSKSPIIKLAFPIKGAGRLSKKIILVTSDYDALMSVYHSDDDLPKQIKSTYMNEALGKLKSLLSESNRVSKK